MYFPLGAPVPAPTITPKAPPGVFSADVTLLLGWLQYIGIIAGVVGFIFCGIQMTIGRRQRHAMAADGAAGIPWVIVGLSVIALSTGIVSAIL